MHVDYPFSPHGASDFAPRRSSRPRPPPGAFSFLNDDRGGGFARGDSGNSFSCGDSGNSFSRGDASNSFSRGDASSSNPSHHLQQGAARLSPPDYAQPGGRSAVHNNGLAPGADDAAAPVNMLQAAAALDPNSSVSYIIESTLAGVPSPHEDPNMPLPPPIESSPMAGDILPPPRNLYKSSLLPLTGRTLRHQDALDIQDSKLMYNYAYVTLA